MLITYVTIYGNICDADVRRYMARFESNKKKLYIGFIGEREAAEYIATSNIGLFNIFVLKHFFCKELKIIVENLTTLVLNMVSEVCFS